MKLELNRRDEKRGLLFKTIDYCLDVTFTVQKDEKQDIEEHAWNNRSMAIAALANGEQIELSVSSLLGQHTFQFKSAEQRENFEKQVTKNRNQLEADLFNAAMRESPEMRKNAEILVARMRGEKLKQENVPPEVSIQSKSLYDEFSKIVESGNKESARNFLTSRVKDFPQEVQNTIITHFFASGVAKVAGKADAGDDDAANRKFFQKVLEMLQEYF